MFQDHAIDKDICIIGEKGMGKTALAEEFAGLYLSAYAADISLLII